jgi:hypothetical protein
MRHGFKGVAARIARFFSHKHIPINVGGMKDTVQDAKHRTIRAGCRVDDDMNVPVDAHGLIASLKREIERTKTDNSDCSVSSARRLKFAPAWF